MNTITIRKATADDLETLFRFEQGIISAERPFDETLAGGTIHYYDLRALLESSEALVLLAVDEETPVACGFARIEMAKPYVTHQRLAYLGCMFTDPQYRGQGIIIKIIEALKEWVLKKEVHEMQLQVYASNEAAIKAYEKAGFQKLLIRMRTSV